ncbi:protein misato 1 [Biomphalaria glabrata]|uniref:Protein misato homolog 1-like n=1 Tax=Biomphalaria glabrata TaxID=6526 RepID=A0A9U8EKB9_BIOGL|nr:protein misato homolog 1-like [Biomphalaria glabrata]KAI8755581.1 protein misato-like protein 1-like [Biomphalaria glabrata]
MSSQEIITLQIGHYSNFVGTHWWNLQESSFVYDPKLLEGSPKEIDHDVLFREGKTIKGDVTYTPRLILFDLKNSLGTLKKDGTLYDVESEESVNWVGDVTLHKAQSLKKNKFLQNLDEELVKKNEDIDSDDIDSDQKEGTASYKIIDPVFGKTHYNLDNVVEVWSDYLRTSFHPRSVFILKDHLHNNTESPFNVFGMGQQVCNNGEEWDEIENRLRFFSEECDYLQGFHILLDSHSAFGGLASSILSYLSEEFSSKSRLSFALTPACSSDGTALERSCRILNSALSLNFCSEHSDLYVPLSLASSLWKSVGSPRMLPHLQYQATLDYHSSSILAASLDTATLPYRKEKSGVKMSNITSAFNALGRKVSALYSSLPFPLRSGASIVDTLMELEKTQPWSSMTPHVNSSSPWLDMCVARGLPTTMINKESHKGDSAKHFTRCTSIDDVIRIYCSEVFPSSQSASFVLRDSVKVGLPFPHIFDPHINHCGFITDTLRPALSGVETVPIMTSLQSNPDVFSYIESLESCVSKFNIAKHQHFIEAGLEPDDFTEMLHNLKSLAQCYKHLEDL